MVTTPNKALPLQNTGDNVDTWGSVLNTQVFSVLDAALGSAVAIALSNTNVTLTSPQYQNLFFQFSGTLTANVTVTLPSGIGGFFMMSNATTGNFTVTIASGGGGTTQILPRNYNAVFYIDGTNVLNPTQPLGQFTDIAAAATIDIGTVPNSLINVTGNGATITSFGSTARSNQSLFQVKFSDVNTIVNSSSLVCPGNSNITTAADDVYTVWYNGSGVYRILGGMLASGQPVIQANQTWVQKPQTVLSGPKTAAGVPNFLPSTSASLNLTSQGVNTTSLMITAAAGYGPSGVINNTVLVSSNITWACSPNSTNYLAYNVATQATVVALLKPIYQFGGSISTTSGQYTYDILAAQMYVGNGSSYTTASVVFMGEAVTNSTTVTSTICYAYQRKFYFKNTTGSLPGPSSNISKSCNIGTNVGLIPDLMIYLNTTGTLIRNLSCVMNSGGANAYGTMMVLCDGYTISFGTTNFLNWQGYAQNGAYQNYGGTNADYVLQCDTNW